MLKVCQQTPSQSRSSTLTGVPCTHQAFNPVAILLISFAFKIQEPNSRLVIIVMVCPSYFNRLETQLTSEA